jgi:hypothetical protein
VSVCVEKQKEEGGECFICMRGNSGQLRLLPGTERVDSASRRLQH